jgi:hypothetical protein
VSDERDPVEPLPRATLRPKRRWSAVWLVPLAFAALSGWLVFAALGQRGIAIEVRFSQGHGIKAGDALRYRGITVGTVRDARLAADQQSIRVRVLVNPDARDITRAGSQFWVVRPQLDLSGAAGLETVVGAKYLSVLPGKGELSKLFVGLEEPPLTEILHPGGLEIILVTPRKGSLRAGAPVSYREIIIGTITSVELARDASSVEARVYIQPEYVALIRKKVKFWKAGGARFSAGLTGLSLAVDSVQSLILGGVNLAIPPAPGNPVPPEHIFTLADEPQQEWLQWVPSLPLYSTSEQPDRPHPQPVAAILSWSHRNLFYLTRERLRRGWLLPVEGGFLGPADMLTQPEDALAGSARLALADTLVPLDLGSEPRGDGLALLPTLHPFTPWTKLRPAQGPEDTLVIAGSDAPPRLIPASRYHLDGEPGWRVDANLSFDASWHGASIVAESDGAVIGLLLVGEDEIRVGNLGRVSTEVAAD